MACITGSYTILQLLFGPYLHIHIVDEIPPFKTSAWCDLQEKRLLGFQDKNFIRRLHETNS